MKLIYFQTRGRAENIRLLCALAELPVEDQYVNTHAEWVATHRPYGQLPVLVLDNGETLSQCKSIIGYIARQAGLYPADSLGIARTEEIMEAAADMASEIAKGFCADDAARSAAITSFKQNCARWLTVWEKLLKDKPFLIGDKVTVADAMAFKCVEDLVMYIGEDEAIGGFPEVARWRSSFGAIKQVADYLKSEKHLPFPMTAEGVAETFKYYGSILRGA